MKFIKTQLKEEILVSSKIKNYNIIMSNFYDGLKKMEKY
jgi:hypothetical protein